MKKWLTVCSVFLMTTVVLSQSLVHLKLIAHYPLENDANDLTGLQNPMNLDNAPFQDGGVFLNGVYIGSGDSNASGAVTPFLNSLSFEELAVSLDFKVTEAYSISRPLLVCGNSWRWMSVSVEPDSTLRFHLNDLPQEKTQTKISLNTVHNVTMTYDSTLSLCKLYFNGAVIDSVTAILGHNNDGSFSSSDGGSSDAFKGIWADVKIYSKDITTGIQSGGEMPERFALLQNYPNPFNPTTSIGFRLSKTVRVSLSLSNILGQEIATLVDNKILPAGEHSVSWNAASQPAGIYFYTLSTADGTLFVRKMALIK